MKKILVAIMFIQFSLISSNINAFDMASPPNSLTVKDNGRVGVGTDNPASLLHIKKGNAALIVEATNATAGTRQLLQLKNKGGIGMRMENTNNNAIWDFTDTDSGNFAVSKVGTGGFEFEVQANGRTKIRSLGEIIFDMRSSGNLIIPEGTVTATNYITSSSRTVKEDFSEVDHQSIMSKLSQLKLTKWRYKDSQVKGHHIGPMAEEFYDLFQLGPDNKHVVATDLASIGLLAAQQLSKQAKKNEVKLLLVEEENMDLKIQLKTQTEQLRNKNELLTKRLTQLEKLVMNIANSDSRISKSKEKIAVNLKIK